MTGLPYDDRAVARRVAEPDKAAPAERSPFERDRARVLHSAAFRRLAAKTQVVGVGEDDFPRTRLTHSLECAQVGRELAAALGADPDLVEAACLAHDLGHPPFGHNGEAALDEAARGCGGFEGNAQSLRVLTRLETKILGAGLNLTRAVLDAATKYPWPRREGVPKFGAYADDLDAFAWLREGAPGERRCLEATVMDWADDVAYSVHDLEDGIQAGLVPVARLRDPDVRDEVAALTARVYSGEPVRDLAAAYDRLLAEPWFLAGFDGSRAAVVALKRTTSELIGRFAGAARRATRAAYGPGPLTRYAAELVVPADVRAECALLKGVTHRYVMARPAALARQAGERRLVAELVEAVHAGAPGTLDPVFREAWREAPDAAARRRVVVDSVASLTDTSARRAYAELTGRHAAKNTA